MWFETGLAIFGALGFLYSSFALAYIFAKEGINLPPFFSYTIRAFGMWISFSVIMVLVGWFAWAIYFNKRNWINKRDDSKKQISTKKGVGNGW